jgi:dihydrofolate synthase/folylpolyglutamate synthase
LQQLAEELSGRRWPVFDDSTAAWQAARSAAGEDDLICVTGSFFLAAELKERVSGWQKPAT